jgi:CheY-like chemotaxis protein
MDGIELKKEILEIGAVPVIFLSAYGQDHIIARAIDIRGGRLRRQTMLADRVDGPVQVVHWQPSVTPDKRPKLP